MNGKRKIAIIAFFAFWGLELFQSFPMDITPPSIHDAQNKALLASVALGFGGNRVMRMFDDPPMRKNVCMFALGLSENTNQFIYAPPMEYCHNPGLRLFYNNVHHSTYRIYERMISQVPEVKNDGRDAYRTRFGEYYCRLAEEKNNAPEKVYVGVFEEWYKKRESGDYKFKKRLRTASAYSCKEKSLVEIPQEEIMGILQRDYPDLYAAFGDYVLNE